MQDALGPRFTTEKCIADFGDKAGAYILENTPPPLGEEKISADVIWGKKYEKAKRKRGKK
jgi:hypothetical protein